MKIDGVKIGDFLELDGLVGVVVGIELDEDMPEDSHVDIWFGLETQKRISQGGSGNIVPEVWIVPIQYCSLAKNPIFRH